LKEMYGDVCGNSRIRKSLIPTRQWRY